jgi:hypothetical protein
MIPLTVLRQHIDIIAEGMRKNPIKDPEPREVQRVVNALVEDVLRIVAKKHGVIFIFPALWPHPIFYR